MSEILFEWRTITWLKIQGRQDRMRFCREYQRDFSRKIWQVDLTSDYSSRWARYVRSNRQSSAFTSNWWLSRRSRRCNIGGLGDQASSMARTENASRRIFFAVHLESYPCPVPNPHHRGPKTTHDNLDMRHIPNLLRQ